MAKKSLLLALVLALLWAIFVPREARAQAAADAGAPLIPAADAGAAASGEPTVMQQDVQPKEPIPTEASSNGSHSIVEFDVQPTVKVLKTDEVEIRAGGLVQIHGVPYVGDDALIANNDPASAEGFRLRRAGFGLEGRIAEKMGALLAVNPIQGGADADRAISNAILWYEVARPLRLMVGTVKVPFSLASLESARTLVGIERPLAVNVITPSRRLGVSAEGQFFNGHVAYLVGFLNGTEGFALGNQFGGYLAGARLEGVLNDRPNAWDRKDGLLVGIDGVYGNTPAVNLVAYSADIYGSLAGAHLKMEGLCDDQKPDESPTLSPVIPDKLSRCGAYLEGGYVLPWIPLQIAARGEVMDDNMAIADAGDSFIFDGGVNYNLIKNHARAQLHYIGRSELKGPSRDNDAVVIALQGTF
jgi:hypothetical protein